MLVHEPSFKMSKNKIDLIEQNVGQVDNSTDKYKIFMENGQILHTFMEKWMDYVTLQEIL